MVEGGCELSKSIKRFSARERDINLGVISIEVEFQRRVGKQMTSRSSIQSEKEGTKYRSLRNAAKEWEIGRKSMINDNRLRALRKV